MDVQQVRRFLAVVSTGSFRRAARELGLSQPALSLSMKQLESGVGAPLFERTPRGVKLTAFGELFLPRAQLIAREFQRVRDDIQVALQARDPELVVCTTPPFAGSLVPQAIAAVLAGMPTLVVRFIQADSSAVLDLLRSGEIDVAFWNPRLDGDYAGLDFEPIFEERYVVAARAGHPLFGAGRRPSRAALREQSWIVHEGAAPLSTVDPVTGKRRAMNSPTRVKVSSQHLIRPILLATDLVGYVAEDLVRREVDDGSLRIVDLPGLSHQSRAGLMVRTGVAYSAAMKAFCREIRLACRAIAKARRGTRPRPEARA